jgi:hypothetical protein
MKNTPLGGDRGLRLGRWAQGRRWLWASLGFGVLLVGPIAQAQQATTSLGTTAVTQYADAILAIEPVRQAAANEMKAVMGDRPLPVVICSQADTVKSLSKEAREIAVSFCNQTKGIIEGAGLSIAQFNQITQSHAIDPALKQRIQEELAKLQQKPPQ